jgi:hypothetical protein
LTQSNISKHQQINLPTEEEKDEYRKKEKKSIFSNIFKRRDSSYRLQDIAQSMSFEPETAIMNDA